MLEVFFFLNFLTSLNGRFREADPADLSERKPRWVQSVKHVCHIGYEICILRSVNKITRGVLQVVDISGDRCKIPIYCLR